jgi:cytochrome c553
MWRAIPWVGLILFPAAGLRPQDAVDLPGRFTRDIRPILQARCMKCHGTEKKKGGIDYAAIADGKAALRERKTWRKAAVQVEGLEMPPEGEKPLADAERSTLAAWMKEAAANVENVGELDPGPPLVRRLNRTEYDLSVRDLLGIDIDVSGPAGIAEEATGHTFDTIADALVLPPALMEKYFTAADLALDRLFMDARRRAAFIGSDGARKLLERVIRRAYRRPAREGEVDRLLVLFERGESKGKPFEESIRLPLKAVLVSPHFLLRIEENRPGTGAVRVGDLELAMRLSYFLWSTMPDEPLLALAGQGKLSEPATLEAQVRRMIASPKARALTTRFAAEWLQLAKFETARPSTEFFPSFTGNLKRAMRQETEMFFDALRTEDRSVLELLDADYTYANQELANHYGIEGVTGTQVRKVALKPGSHRGGLLGMGTMLAATSHTHRTSPTLRGKWILEVLFGTPPPPPPPDAGTIKEEGRKGKEPKSFRELMAMHATLPTCAACHRKIDPLGFALENFDAVGGWRDSQGGKPLDITGELPTGEKISGVDELKRTVLARADAFEHNLVEQMMCYALGRDLQGDDEVAVREVKAALGRDGHRFSALVLGIARSFPFQNRRGAERKD